MQSALGICRLIAVLLLIDFLTGISALASGEKVHPTGFYIVSEVISDASPFWYHYILAVMPAGHDSYVRYIRIAPMDSMCPESITVKAATSRLPNISPGQLAAAYNLCSVDSVALNRNLDKRTHTAIIDDAVRFGIVENCGSKEVALHLPYPEGVNLEALRKKSPELARWWDFQNSIKERAFGSGKVFYDISPEEEEQLQREGEVVVPELRSGRFDRGLNPHCAPFAPCPPPSFRDELNRYVGALGFADPVPRLMEADQYQFQRYFAPKYPLLAGSQIFKGPSRLTWTSIQTPARCGK